MSSLIGNDLNLSIEANEIQPIPNYFISFGGKFEHKKKLPDSSSKPRPLTLLTALLANLLKVFYFRLIERFRLLN